MNENIVSFSCICKNSPEKNRQSLNYESHNFQRFKLYDGCKYLVFTDCKKLIEYLDTVTMLVCPFGYFDLGMMFYQLEKAGITDYYISKIGTCNLPDLYKILRCDVPQIADLKVARDEYLRLQPKLPQIDPYMEFRKCWITIGERKKSKNSGKWIIFSTRDSIATYWQIIKHNFKYLAADCIRVTTMAINLWGGSDRVAVIMLFYENTPSKKELMKRGGLINDLCPSAISIAYKTDAQSEHGNSIMGTINNSFVKIK